MQLQAASGNIVRFVNEVSLSFRELAQCRSIEFEVVSEQPKITLWFDRDKFEIILINLLSNALKFTPDHGKISFFIRKENIGVDADGKSEISIAIENSGRGIPENQAGLIFERFYSGSQSK